MECTNYTEKVKWLYWPYALLVVGNLIKETTFNKDGAEKSYIQHEYENGVNIRSLKHGSEYIKTYDENNNLVSLKSIHPSGSSKMGGTLKYEYFDQPEKRPAWEVLIKPTMRVSG